MADFAKNESVNQGVIVNSFKLKEFEQLVGPSYFSHVDEYVNADGELRGGYDCVKFTSKDFTSTKTAYLSKSLELSERNFKAMKDRLNIVVIDNEDAAPTFICCLSQSNRVTSDMADGSDVE